MFTLGVNSIIIKTVIFNGCSKLLRRNTKHLNTTASLQTLKNLENENSSVDIENIEDKVIYNSVIKHGRMVHGKPNTFSVAEEVQYKKEGSPVLALKYFTKEFCNERNLDCENNAGVGLTKEKNENIHFPYEKHHEVTINDLLESTSDTSTAIDVYEDVSSRELNRNLFFNEVKDNPTSKRPGRKWMKDYNKYAEVSVKITEEEDKEDYSWDVNYGSADPKVPASRVPCGGCGANLHCQDSAIPGYLPKEIFFGLEEKQLQTLVCQRCHFLQEYGTALSVRVDPEIYPQLLSQIKSKMALVILVVDMTDFPCSIWPGIIDIIGPKRPLVVVGNKIDLLQDFNKHWLTRAKEALRQQLPRKANVLHVTLVSAKTGYGIEDLITSLYNLWEYRGDVYLVGCTNVGKSSLFNALLQSDYCKTKAVDLIQRATTAPWPGTTLSLLKFPITRPEGWRLAERASRLRRQSAEDLRLIQERKTYITPQMISLIGRTFSHSNLGKFTDDYEEDPFALPKLSTLRLVRGLGEGLDPSDPVFANSRWFYDTPGVVTKDQIIDLLTTEELMLTLSQEPLIPRTLQVWPGQSLLVGGLARIDYISGPANIKMTVLAAMKLPVTLCWISDADVVYQHYLGSAALAVPCGGKERLTLWPGLNAGTEFVLKGTGWKESCADIVLSSAGWVAVTAQQNTLCQLQAWTPQARGIHVRIPPVLPRAIALKGCKIHKTQAYALFNKDVKKFK